jgi:signal transduction histidine kinase
MNNPFRTIRWKILGLFFFSLALSAITTFLLFLIVVWFYNSNRDMTAFRSFIRMLERDIGYIPVVSVSVAVLFVCYVFVLSWKHIRYLVQITDAVKLIADGRLDHQIGVRTQDELGELASNINQMASQLKASIEEERLAVKGKNELVTNVSHDLRTPLTSIMGYLQLINEDRYQDEVELRYYVDIAYTKSRRLNRLVNDLFEYTSMGYGQTVLVRKEIDLLELIGQVAADYTLQLSEASMVLQLVLPEERMIIHADGDKLMRAFENLITNAIKYGKDGKRMDIVVKKESDSSVVVRVVNYGKPIPAIDLPRIMERFYRAEKSRSDETGGSGLGLAIVKSIIDLHDGSITVSSDEHETAFEVRLPLYHKQSI